MLEQLNTNCKISTFEENLSYHLDSPSPLFQRIDKEKFFLENVK